MFWKKKKKKYSLLFTGSIIADEVALSKGVNFNKSTLKVEGFVNLGDYTPEDQKNEIADHALNLMFRLYKGSAIQVLAAFLTKGAVKGEQLFYVIMEAILVERRRRLMERGYAGQVWRDSRPSP